MANPSDLISQLNIENASLRDQLENARAKASDFSGKPLAISEAEDPFVMPTDEELFEMIHGPRGRSPWEVLEEFEREYGEGAIIVDESLPPSVDPWPPSEGDTDEVTSLKGENRELRYRLNRKLTEIEMNRAYLE